MRVLSSSASAILTCARAALTADSARLEAGRLAFDWALT